MKKTVLMETLYFIENNLKKFKAQLERYENINLNEADILVVNEIKENILQINCILKNINENINEL